MPWRDANLAWHARAPSLAAFSEFVGRRPKKITSCHRALAIATFFGPTAWLDGGESVHSHVLRGGCLPRKTSSRCCHGCHVQGGHRGNCPSCRFRRIRDTASVLEQGLKTSYGGSDKGSSHGIQELKGQEGKHPKVKTANNRVHHRNHHQQTPTADQPRLPAQAPLVFTRWVSFSEHFKPKPKLR